MSRKNSRRTARRSRTRNHSHRSQSSLGRLLYRRKLRLEPLEDRRLLAVVTVTTLSDTVDLNDGVTSLREAIFAANTVPGADTIQFDPSLTAGGPATILLKSGLPQIIDALAIDGPGADLLTIDGRNSGLYDVLYAAPSDFSISAPGVFGLDVSALTIADSNTKGITAFHVDLTVRDSAIIGNRQGGIASGFGSLKVVSSRITGNSLTEPSGFRRQFAAGISTAYGDVSVIDTTISNNSSNSQGGGISLYFTSSASIVDCTIVGNSARFGGGIFTRADTPLSISGSTISNNTAVYHGGGLYAHRNPSVTITSSVLDGNHAGQNGGAVDSSNPPLFITGSMITGNTAGRLGGGIFTFGPATIVATSVIGNSSGHDGGGISAYRVALDSSTISGNSAIGDGGGIWVGASFGSAIPRSTITRSTIAFNTAGSSGGGLFATVGTVVLDNSIVARNSAISGRDLTGLIGAGFQPHFSLIGSNAQSGLAASPSDMPDGNGNNIGPYYNPINPRLGPLVNNSGPTLPDGSTPKTHGLLPGSPAINAGDPAAVAGMNGVPQYDQRGTPWSRVSGGRIDIGAVEFQLNPLAGDYNFNGVVDAADYTVWRDTLGSTTDLRADAMGTDGVNQLDYEVWKENFGATLAHGNATSISAPVSAAASSAMPQIQADSAAGPIVVTTLADTVDLNDGVTSLREAIFAANVVSGADTIQFDPALTAGGPAKILLTHGELKITDSLTIDGPGSDSLTIDASGNDPTPSEVDGKGTRVINIDDDNPHTQIGVLIRGLTVSGGDTRSFGGGIFSYESLSLSNVTLTHNSSLGEGGALFVSLDSAGTVSIESSVVSENLCAANGGGMSIRLSGGASASIVDSRISGDSAMGSGGGVSIFHASEGGVSIGRSQFLDNKTEGFGGPGGAVYISHRGGGYISVVDSEFSRNAATAPGAGMCVRSNTSGNVSISGNRFVDNSALGTFASGGGAYILVGGTGNLAVSENVFSGNTTSGTEASGGGLAVERIGDGTTTIRDNIATENMASGTSHYGAGMYVSAGGGAVVHVDSNTVKDNLGSGIASNTRSGGSVFVEGNLASGNLAGIYVFSQGMTAVTANIVTGNHGGLSLNAVLGGIVHSDHNIVTDNHSDFAAGGMALGAQMGGAITVLDSLIARNTSNGVGAGVYAFVQTGGSIDIAGTTVSDNRILSEGVYGEGNGAGVYATNYGGSIIIEQSTVASNSALMHGGGLWVDNRTTGTVVIRESTVAANEADSDHSGTGNGGGISVSGSMQLVHATITGNFAPVGGGVFISTGVLATNDTLVAGNFASIGRDIGGYLGASVLAHYSLVGDGSGSSLAEAPVGSPDADGNLIGGPVHGVIDPKIGPLADNGSFALPNGRHILTHALLPGSPAINTGDPSEVAGANGVPASDERGTPFTRVFGGRIDIGAVEYEPAGFLAGDFNRNGVVDAADYTGWRDSRGNNVVANGSGADGNGDGVVNDLDYGVWRTNFGATLPVASGGVGSAAIQVKGIQPPALPGVGGAGALRFDASASSPPAEPGAAVLATRQPLSVTARNELLFADWRTPRNGLSRILGDIKANRPRGDAATDEVNGDRVSAVDSVFTALDARF